MLTRGPPPPPKEAYGAGSDQCRQICTLRRIVRPYRAFDARHRSDDPIRARVLFPARHDARQQEEMRLQTDQELFAKGLATYQKVVNENFMAHKEVYGLLRQVLVTEAPDQFVFLDIACGTATGSAEALKGTNVGRCIGVDISRPSLDVAQGALRNLHCPVEVRCQDFVEASIPGMNRSMSHGLVSPFTISVPGKSSIL